MVPCPQCLQSARHGSHMPSEACVLCQLLDSLRRGRDQSPPTFPRAGAGSAGACCQFGAGRGGMGPGATILAPSSMSPCESAVGCEPLSVRSAPALSGLYTPHPPHPPRLVQPYRTQQGCTRHRWRAEWGEAALGWRSQAAFEAGCGQSGTL